MFTDTLVHNRDAIYNLSYFLAVAVRAWIFFAECRQRQFPLSRASLVILFSFLFFLAGTKFLTFSPADWQWFFSHGTLPAAPGKTVLGGILLGYAGFVLGARLYRAPLMNPDLLAVAAPVAFGIQRLGCLAAGCCYGNLWPEHGITYPACTPAGHAQIDAGIIAADATQSAGVVPVPLILALGCFGIAMVVYLMKRRYSLKRGYFLPVLSAYLLLSFFTDFFRAGYNNPAFAEPLAGLKRVQWAELTGATLFLVIYLLLPRKAVRQPVYREIPVQAHLITGLLAVFVLVHADWFSAAEQASLLFTLAAAVILNADRLYRRSYRFYQVFAMSSILLAVVFARPAFGQNEPWLKISQAAYPDSGRHVYRQLDLGLGMEDHYHFHDARYYGSSCGSGYRGVYPEYRHRTGFGGLNYQYVATNGKYRRFTLGGGINIGLDREESLDSNYINNRQPNNYGSIPTSHYRTGGINGFYIWDTKWLGLGTGMFIGSYFNPDDYKGYVAVSQGDPALRIGINYYVRLGNYRTFYFYSRNAHSMINNFNFRGITDNYEVGMGSGLGLRNGTAVNIGVETMGEESMAVVEFRYMYRNSAGVQFRSTYSGETGTGIQFGVSYRFGQR